MFKALNRQSLSDQVFTQLRDRILGGDMLPGAELPSERELSEHLKVSRSAIREALKQLAQARLITINQGESTRVLDYRQSAGLNLLSALIVDSEGQLRTSVVRSIMEMRAAIAPDIARLAAKRGGPELASCLEGVVRDMEDAHGDDAALQSLAITFWDHLVDGSGNVAYRLIYNTLIDNYRSYEDLLAQALSPEHQRRDLYDEISACVQAGDCDGARAHAHTLSQIGHTSICILMDALNSET